MNPSPFQSFTLPRIMILASALLTGSLLIAAPMVLPHVSSAETGAPPISSGALIRTNSALEPARPSKPSAAHRATRMTVPQPVSVTSETSVGRN